jgi:hypothetical protein
MPRRWRRLDEREAALNERQQRIAASEIDLAARWQLFNAEVQRVRL